MEVSVVIATYKRPFMLLKCLEALAAQNFSSADYEVIVVSDGIDDDTSSLFKYFTGCNRGHHFYYNFLSKKRGPAAARNCGWRMAKGKLILFTDDDCLPDKNWIARMWEAYIFTGLEYIAFTGEMIVPFKDVPTDYEKNIGHLTTAEFVTANCACSEKALESINGFDEHFTMAWREDSDLQFRLLHSAILIKSVPAIVVHPVRPAKWGVSLKEQKKTMFNALLYKKHPFLYTQKIHESPSLNYYGMILLLSLAIVAASYKAFLPAVVCLLAWISLALLFTLKRLKGTSKQTKHIAEMLVTSMLIPFFSVYWSLYGSIKFKKLLL